MMANLSSVIMPIYDNILIHFWKQFKQVCFRRIGRIMNILIFLIHTIMHHRNFFAAFMEIYTIRQPS